MTMRPIYVLLLASFYAGQLFGEGQKGVFAAIVGQAYLCAPTSLNLVGRCALVATEKNAWQAVVSAGTSAYAYPYFLLRNREGGGVDIVFFNEAGKGYSVDADEVTETELGLKLAIGRRGGGEAGSWKLRQTFTLSRANGSDRLSVVVNGEQTSTQLLFFKHREVWRIEFQFGEAKIDHKVTESARLISKALIKND